MHGGGAPVIGHGAGGGQAELEKNRGVRHFKCICDSQENMMKNKKLVVIIKTFWVRPHPERLEHGSARLVELAKEVTVHCQEASIQQHEHCSSDVDRSPG